MHQHVIVFPLEVSYRSGRRQSGVQPTQNRLPVGQSLVWTMTSQLHSLNLPRSLQSLSPRAASQPIPVLLQACHLSSSEGIITII